MLTAKNIDSIKLKSNEVNYVAFSFYLFDTTGSGEATGH
jgi:hypothetical protein